MRIGWIVLFPFHPFMALPQCLGIEAVLWMTVKREANTAVHHSGAVQEELNPELGLFCISIPQLVDSLLSSS